MNEHHGPEYAVSRTKNQKFLKARRFTGLRCLELLLLSLDCSGHTPVSFESETRLALGSTRVSERYRNLPAPLSRRDITHLLTTLASEKHYPAFDPSFHSFFLSVQLDTMLRYFPLRARARANLGNNHAPLVTVTAKEAIS